MFLQKHKSFLYLEKKLIFLIFLKSKFVQGILGYDSGDTPYMLILYLTNENIFI